MKTTADQGLSLEPDVVRLPAEVLEAGYFEISGDEPVTFDLTQTAILATPAIRGLLRTLRAVGQVHLVIPPGQPLRKLCAMFSTNLRRVAPCEWELSL